jgi:hypothetical protein
MATLRPNTFVMDLSNITKRANSETIHNFILKTLELDFEEVVSIQIAKSKKLVFVETKNEERAIETVHNNDLKHKIEFGGVEFTVKLYMDDNGTDIKISDLPPNMPNQYIWDKLSEYGEILSSKDEVWGENFAFKGIKTGDRIVRIVLRKNIPSFVTINGETAYVTYSNQILTCRWCAQKLHFGMTCTENKVSVNDRLHQSFAEAVKAPQTKIFTPQQQQQQQQQQQHHQHSTTKPIAQATSTVQQPQTNQNLQNPVENNINNLLKTTSQQIQLQKTTTEIQSTHMIQIPETNVFFTPSAPPQISKEIISDTDAMEVTDGDSDASSSSLSALAKKQKKETIPAKPRTRVSRKTSK